jgi:hypothetical protein
MLSPLDRLQTFAGQSNGVGATLSLWTGQLVPFQFGLSPLALSAWLDLPGAWVPAYIALRITETLKPSHHNEVKDQPPHRGMKTLKP